MSEIEIKLSNKEKERAVKLELSDNETKLKVYLSDNETELEVYSGSKRKKSVVESKLSKQNDSEISQIRETALEKKMKSE